MCRPICCCMNYSDRGSRCLVELPRLDAESASAKHPLSGHGRHGTRGPVARTLVGRISRLTVELHGQLGSVSGSLRHRHLPLGLGQHGRRILLGISGAAPRFENISRARVRPRHPMGGIS